MPATEISQPGTKGCLRSCAPVRIVPPPIVVPQTFWGFPGRSRYRLFVSNTFPFPHATLSSHVRAVPRAEHTYEPLPRLSIDATVLTDPTRMHLHRVLALTVLLAISAAVANGQGSLRIFFNGLSIAPRLPLIFLSVCQHRTHNCPIVGATCIGDAAQFTCECNTGFTPFIGQCQAQRMSPQALMSIDNDIDIAILLNRDQPHSLISPATTPLPTPEQNGQLLDLFYKDNLDMLKTDMGISTRVDN